MEYEEYVHKIMFTILKSYEKGFKSILAYIKFICRVCSSDYLFTFHIQVPNLIRHESYSIIKQGYILCKTLWLWGGGDGRWGKKIKNEDLGRKMKKMGKEKGSKLQEKIGKKALKLHRHPAVGRCFAPPAATLFVGEKNESQRRG